MQIPTQDTNTRYSANYRLNQQPRGSAWGGRTVNNRSRGAKQMRHAIELGRGKERKHDSQHQTPLKADLPQTKSTGDAAMRGLARADVCSPTTQHAPPR